MAITTQFKSAFITIDDLWESGNFPIGKATTSTGTVYFYLGEPYEPKKQSQANKCSVQEPPRKKNIRFLNRPA